MLLNIFVVYSFVSDLCQQYLILWKETRLPSETTVCLDFKKTPVLLHFARDERELERFPIGDYEHIHYSMK